MNDHLHTLTLADGLPAERDGKTIRYRTVHLRETTVADEREIRVPDDGRKTGWRRGGGHAEPTSARTLPNNTVKPSSTGTGCIAASGC